MAITLNIHIKSHTVRGRPTPKLVERFGNGSVCEHYEKYQTKQAISNEVSHIMFTCKHNRVFRRNREPSRIPEATLKRLRRKDRKPKEFVYERIRVSIPNSSWLRLYVKVRRVTKNVCKFHTKRARLPVNKVAQNEKYLLNVCVRVYQRIIKLKYRASRALGLSATIEVLNDKQDSLTLKMNVELLKELIKEDARHFDENALAVKLLFIDNFAVEYDDHFTVLSVILQKNKFE